MTYLPHPHRVKLVKLCQEWRPKAKHMSSDAMHKELARIVFDYETDSNGNEKPVYMMEHQRAAIVSYAYCWEPSAHDMAKV